MNRSEQMVLDYVCDHPDERQFWLEKVRITTLGSLNIHDAALVLEEELWAYYAERSRVVEPFRSAVAREGLRRTSMRNLAEYWCRLWGVIKQPKERGKTYDGY